MFMGILLSCSIHNPSDCFVTFTQPFATRAECEKKDTQDAVTQFSYSTQPDYIPVEYYCHEWKWEFPNV